MPLERCRAGEPIASFLAAIHEEDRPRVEAAIEHALETGEPYRAEYRVRSADGAERWVDGRGRVERDAEGDRDPAAGRADRHHRAAPRRGAAAGQRAALPRDHQYGHRRRAADGCSRLDRGLESGGGADLRRGARRSHRSGTGEHIIPERLREAHRQGLAHFLATREGPVLGRRLELPAIRRDGSEFPVELSINPLPVGRGSDVRGLHPRHLAAQGRRSGTGRARPAFRAARRYRVAPRFAAELAKSLHGCCELLVRHLDASFARIWVLDEAENVLVLRASAGLYTHLDGPHGRVPVGQFKIGRIAQSRRAHLTNDVAHDPNISEPGVGGARRHGRLCRLSAHRRCAAGRAWSRFFPNTPSPKPCSATSRRSPTPSPSASSAAPPTPRCAPRRNAPKSPRAPRTTFSPRSRTNSARR